MTEDEQQAVLGEDEYVYFRLDPSQTNYINRIIEGYEYLGVMTTVDREQGIAMVRSTAGTRDMVIEVLESLGLNIKILMKS